MDTKSFSLMTIATIHKFELPNQLIQREGQYILMLLFDCNICTIKMDIKDSNMCRFIYI